MIFATLAGRLQTKLLTYVLLGIITFVFVMMDNHVYLWAYGVAMVVGLLLETLWGITVEYQPGWLAFVFGAIEFALIVLVTAWFGVPMAVKSAAIFYLVSWSIIQLFLIYILPVWRTSWGEDGGELW